MTLSIHYVRSLADVIEPAVSFLSRPGDVFAVPRIVVPHAGAKAWLHDRLARRLGSSRPDREDGIVANVDISFPGTITALLQPPRDAAVPDPWAFDRLTFAVLHVITRPDAAGLGVPIDLDREPLLTARRIAGLFDEYHVRRPGMIREWELGNPVLAPTANDKQTDGHAMAASLRDGDLWQFNVWRAVRQHLGTDRPSPPIRQSIEQQPSRERLLVAGLESLSLPQLDCLEKLGAVCEVEAFLVHPSPGLRKAWAATGPQPLPEKLRDRPLEKRRDPDFQEGIDALLPVWLSGARELQDLVAARGSPVADAATSDEGNRPDSLLVRMQATVARGGEAVAATHDLATDRSIVIHRCHTLSRQAEVLHDALLQAFDEIEGLEPHEVAILSPCIQKAAPHLEAVFQRTVAGRDPAGTTRKISLPLVVADRGIRETNEAADLMAALLALPGSRASIDDVLAVAGHPLVRTRFGIDDDTVATWADFVARTKVRWGLDAGHRSRRGLALAANADIHTWKLGLERMLLGAMLPDGVARPELGGVVPLADLDPADLIAITPLVSILDVIRTLEVGTSDRLPAGDWCNSIEQALVGLCDEESPHLAEPLAHLRRLREAAAGTAAEHLPVPFEDVHRLLVTWLDEQAGRQPLRTGAITATSMVPLRGVPFRVVCVIGYDDGVVGSGESDGDDLVARQSLLGDVDPRGDERRALLDCLLAAGERLVITCNGRNAKSNKRVPLVTPLAELVDFAVRHGVSRARIDEASGIEIDHPRHQLGRQNFEEAGVLPKGVWSHDAIAADVLEAATLEGQPAPVPQRSVSRRNEAAPAEKPRIELSLLEKLVQDPLKLYLEKTLGIDTWQRRTEEIPATIPLTLTHKEVRELADELILVLEKDPADADRWTEAKRRSGRLAYGPLGAWQLEEITGLASGIVNLARQKKIPLVGTAPPNEPLDLGRFILVGDVDGIHDAAGEGQLVMRRTGVAQKNAYDRPFHVAAIRLLAAKARGATMAKACILARNRSWSPGALTDAGKEMRAALLSTVLLAPGIDPVHRLAELCDLAQFALSGPCGLFGLADSSPEARAKDFEEYVNAKAWNAGQPGYRTSTESMVYGMSPVFDEIFRSGSRELECLDCFCRCMKLSNRKGTSEYTLA